MKKFIALMLVACVCCLSVSCAFAASAGTLEGNKFWYDKHVGTTSTDASTMVPVDPVGNPYAKTTSNQRINVYFNCYDGNNTLTNYFRPYQFSTGKACGSKWVTPAMEIPIRSDSTVTGYRYNVKARGNTDHALAEYGGKRSVGLFGFYETN